MKTPTIQHTPTPWIVGKTYERDDPEFHWETDIDISDECVGMTFGKTREDAEIAAASIARAVNSHAALKEALLEAISAAEYSIGLLEANVRAGDSPNGREKADWIGSCAHVYAAMSFVGKARAAISKAEGPK